MHMYSVGTSSAVIVSTWLKTVNKNIKKVSMSVTLRKYEAVPQKGVVLLY